MLSNNGRKLALHFSQPPKRVVSLVPSLTESLFDLGFGASVVGITDYCTHPAEALQALPRLGGPKNPRLEQILALNPDLILLNQEENTRSLVKALEAEGAPVWLTFPRTVREALDILWTLAGVFQSPTAAARIETIERAVKWNTASVEDRIPTRYFCPIWQEKGSGGTAWWMTFNRHTYAADVLRILGGENVFATRHRRYPLAAEFGQADEQDPGGADTRYPRVPLEEIQAAAPDLILLPSEPFEFLETHRDEICRLLAGTPAVEKGRIHLVDGSLITWHGTRLARAIQELPALFASPA